MSSSIFITSAFAPPCSGPFSAPMAPTIVEWMSVSVAAATRAANVEAFSSWSACSTSDTSNARAASADGRWPVSMYRKFAAWPSAGSGSMYPPPAAKRPHVATIDPSCPVRRTALR